MDAWSGSHPPTKTLPFHGDMTKGRLCHVPASFSEMGGGQPKNHQAVSKQSVFIFLFARFSQSELLPTSSDGTVASSKDRKKSSTLFLTPSHPPFPVRLH